MTEPRPEAFYESEGGCPSCGDPAANNAAWEIEHYIAWAVNECKEHIEVEEEVNHIADIIAWHKKNVHRVAWDLGTMYVKPDGEGKT